MPEPAGCPELNNYQQLAAGQLADAALLLGAEQRGNTEWLKFSITANSVKGD